MIVLDASAVIELLLDTRLGREVRRRISAPGESLSAPHLVDVEVTQVLRRFERHGTLTAARAAAALDDLRDLRMTRHPHTPFLAAYWGLRANLTAYDAAYVTLAQALDAPLLTCDSRLAGAPTGARIEVLS